MHVVILKEIDHIMIKNLQVQRVRIALFVVVKLYSILPERLS